ncbi:hypothetical protein MUK42_35797 [Musa troglodytarum]|uniref:Uncharacterized protein n=1 Tax=Musa troglodytarum TaxID=320322 RepID=A0A9E7KUX6_9LILI|nr:hypothetical protein MUK42_35797 [Musa troglodytarum]
MRFTIKMRPKANGTLQRGQKLNHYKGDGPNWVLIAGGALLGTLSIRLGCKLKQAFETKLQDNANTGNRKFTPKIRSAACQMNSNLYQFHQNEDAHYRCLSVAKSLLMSDEAGFPNWILDRPNFCLADARISGDGTDIKQSKNPMSTEMDLSLQLVKFSDTEPNKESGSVIWASSPDHLELPQKPFHRSSSSDSPCMSESGSDIYSKREVIQKLRQQLKRRDDMIMEMQAQVIGLQNSLSIQATQSADLQAQVDAANRDLFESEREIQRSRKIIADYCAVKAVSPEKPARHWCPEGANGYANGVDEGDFEKIEMLKMQVGELKEVIEGKDFLLQNYKEQKVELSSKIKELQLKLDSHVPNIL